MSTGKDPSGSLCALVPVVGIVGGIGSGKSSVARAAAQMQRIHIVDADRIGHDLLLDESVREAIQNRFGRGVFDESGQIDRRSLAGLVFGPSDEHKTALDDLEAILHPRIRAEMHQQIQEISNHNGGVVLKDGVVPVQAIILDAALLIEANWHTLCDAVVFIDTPLNDRQQRVVNRGWTSDELKKRENSQLSLEDKQKHCQYTIDNSGSLESAAAQLAQILKELQTEFSTNESPVN